MPFYITRNVSPPYRVSERAVKLAREKNELDLELYGFAGDIIAGQLDRQSRSLALRSRPTELCALSRAAAGRT